MSSVRRSVNIIIVSLLLIFNAYKRSLPLADDLVSFTLCNFYGYNFNISQNVLFPINLISIFVYNKAQKNPNQRGCKSLLGLLFCHQIEDFKTDNRLSNRIATRFDASKIKQFF